ncbi:MULTISPECIES: pseudouridine synthase [unclassified Paludibacterium]|uniref:pseudouridine synthase n=1 Tax=unclassified Paludibacterium TaxID=2618429 RepID=UPI001C059DE0|nr:16S rRNA pseudouridine(516) synthase [Paludibacterium sp. B53371]BEV72817.1 16S rRNA pseudouridine(516) synthase [Paludibacterium sp. THUN1379]
MELIKFLQQQGLGSRKVCRQLVRDGRVSLDGRCVTDPDLALDPDAIGQLCIDDEVREILHFPLYVLLNKPGDVEVSHQPQHYPSVFSLLPPSLQQAGLAAVGRLDADTTGLLLLTTDGQFVHALTSPRRHVAKRYRVTLKHPLTDEMLDRLKAGVILKDDIEPTRADAVEPLDAHTLLLTISEGRYHQVKRMVAAAGNRVTALHREAMGALTLGELAEGSWRYLTASERQGFGF